ncbi:YajG family lipoprotein [Nitrincola sp.]|uniref:YajG family lipoprotein n=1 Tax=Nitrincola sp. TaxID=1926584 RepID=UPI003A909830
MRPTLRLILIVTCIALIAGCSGPTPQRVNLQPEVISVPRLPQSMPLRVDVAYPSRQLQIGSIADRLGNEVPVSITDDIRTELTQAALKTLERMGVVTSSQANAQLTLTLENISYHLRSDGVRRELIGVMRINMEAVDGQRRYQGGFESETREEILRTPTDQKTREFLNDLASEVLFQAFNDPEFTRYLIAGAR